MPGSIACPACPVLVALVLTANVVAAPSAAGREARLDEPAGAAGIPTAAREALRARSFFAPDPASYLLLRLPPADADRFPNPGDQLLPPWAGVNGDRKVIPEDFALPLLHPGPPEFRLPAGPSGPGPTAPEVPQRFHEQTALVAPPAELLSQPLPADPASEPPPDEAEADAVLPPAPEAPITAETDSTAPSGAGPDKGTSIPVPAPRPTTVPPAGLSPWAGVNGDRKVIPEDFALPLLHPGPPEFRLPAGPSGPGPTAPEVPQRFHEQTALVAPPAELLSQPLPADPASEPPPDEAEADAVLPPAPEAPITAETDSTAPSDEGPDERNGLPLPADPVSEPPADEAEADAVLPPAPEAPITAETDSTAPSGAGPDKGISIPVPAPRPTTVPPAGLSGPDPVKMVTIPLGQSRRWVLDYQATAVFAATPEIADVRLLSPDVLYVIGRGVGRTSVAVLDDQGLLDEWLVTTVLDLEPMHALLASDPGFSGVSARHFSRGVTLIGEVASAAMAERAERLAAATLPENAILENEIRIAAPQQVNLEVQIAEVQRSVTESLGISWEVFNRVGAGALAWQIGRPVGEQVPSAFEALLGLPGWTTGFVDGQPTASIAGRYQGSRGAVQVVVDALANAGLANVLARPNLTAISGETASFFSGGEYPLPIGFRDGVIIFEYKKFGVLLDFVPTVVDPDRITLTVRPEVSETSDNQSLITVGTEIPVINVRRAETTVEIGNGESIVIAGLFRSGSNTVESGLPGLKDLPGVGLLFRQDRVEATETELIVVVTANLVRSGTPRSEPVFPARMTRQIHGYYY